MTVPPDVPAVTSLDGLAPKFRRAVELLLVDVPDAVVSESLRTSARQAFLYGFGRDYDDGRGVVTHAQSALDSWHAYGLAVDIVHRTLQWDAGDAWFARMGERATALGLEWGGHWRTPDRPHVQFGTLKDRPSDTARALYAAGGLPTVWRAVRAS